MSVEAAIIADPSSGGRWMRLAAVARERAAEHTDMAAGATSSRAAKPYLDLECDLTRLAKVYEGRAMLACGDRSPRRPWEPV